MLNKFIVVVVVYNDNYDDNDNGRDADLIILT